MSLSFQPLLPENSGVLPLVGTPEKEIQSVNSEERKWLVLMKGGLAHYHPAAGFFGIWSRNRTN